MPEPIRIRALLKDDITDVHVLMPHPMETGLRQDDAGQFVAAHFITEVQIQVAGRVVLKAALGRGVSADPLLHFRLRGVAAGERISVAWVDTRGERRRDESAIQAA